MRLLTVILYLITSISYAQDNVLMIGSKQYISSKSYKLHKDWKNSSPYASKGIWILFAKDGDKGIVAVKVPSDGINRQERVLNNLIIYLDDLSVITCIDRKDFDIVDAMSTTLYRLTPSELNKMKKSNIRTVRYTIGSSYNEPTEGESFTVPNEKIPDKTATLNGHTAIVQEGRAKIDFPSVINKLFTE